MMKKKLLILSVLMGILSACSNSSTTTTTVCKTNSDTDQKDEVRIEYDKDKKVIEEIEYTKNLSLKKSNYTAESIKSQTKDYKEKIKNVEGVSFEYKIDGDKYTDKTIIKPGKDADFLQLKELGLINTTSEDGKKIEYKKEIEAIKANGLVCKEEK